ncbi:3-hydroxyacyl-CoA dehydrogenase type-2-like [Paramacrobiotus metropolitanus]|uniref:3-hydroxyacyl-CoA dehydrogenase type-2-like n=1 Tax=Paramacrobiotus metropolitanus TaxID=2943436 RepID=UPI0024462757|nr:3-hydroxyacyl-CoA dehydrogenase type-2-like [Paramacrobiotus metropolitanus]
MAHFKDKVALVTGGSSGLGKATVERLASKGVIIYVVDLQIPSQEDGGDIYGDASIKYRKVDVTREDDVANVISEIRYKQGRLDFLINCAGILGHVQPVYDFHTDQMHSTQMFEDIMRINVYGTFNVIRHAVGLMSTNPPDEDGQRGVIVNVSSVARSDGQVGLLAYSASKGAISSMTVPLAREFGPVGIRVLAIAPAAICTPMLDNEEYKWALAGHPSSAVFPKRVGRPEEFAHMVEFIIENHLVNATTMRLDGGFRNFPGSARSDDGTVQ